MYIERDSIIHRLDPRGKLIWLICSFIWSIVFNHPYWVIYILLLNLSVAITSKTLLAMKLVISGTISLIVMSTLMWPFFIIGEIESHGWGTLIYVLGPVINLPLNQIGIDYVVHIPILVTIPIYKEALYYAFAMGLRVSTMIVSGFTFLATTKMEDLTTGLCKMGLPYSLAFGFTTSFRFIPTLFGDAMMIINAQRARGLDIYEGGIIEKSRKMVPLMVPLFVTTFRRAGELAMAVESRGFRAKEGRTYLKVVEMKKKDYFFAIGSIILTALFVYLRIQGFGVVLPWRL